MSENLQLKERIKKNWSAIILAFAFLITLQNYLQVKAENERLKGNSINAKKEPDAYKAHRALIEKKYKSSSRNNESENYE